MFRWCQTCSMLTCGFFFGMKWIHKQMLAKEGHGVVCDREHGPPLVMKRKLNEQKRVLLLMMDKEHYFLQMLRRER